MDSLTELFSSMENLDDLKPGSAPSLECVEEGRLTSAADATRFILGGNATFTLKSKATGARFTFRVRKPKDVDPGRDPVFFVSLMNGPDNESQYAYFGFLRRGVYFHGGRKARVAEDAPSAKAFAWAYRALMRGEIPAQLEVWHEGRCCRCGRKLTVPESIKSGIGPECASRMGG